jgi:hypothetical protein
MDLEQIKYRILAKTVKTPNCWFFTGAKNGGYGAIIIKGKRIVAHKLMYQIEVGVLT